jgi:hypothetical protein
VKAIARDEVWNRLRTASLVDGVVPSTFSSLTPWYVRVMHGVAGWIAALLLVGFLATAFLFRTKSFVAAAVTGVAMCAAAVMLFRIRSNSDFLRQFALAVGIAGQALVSIGTAFVVRDPILSATMSFGLQATLFLLIPDFLFRILAAYLGTAAAVQLLGSVGVHAFALPLILGLTVWISLNELRFLMQRPYLSTLGHGMALWLVYAIWSGLSRDFGFHWMQLVLSVGRRAGLFSMTYLVGQALCGGVFIWLVWKLLDRHGVPKRSGVGRAAMWGAMVVALMSLQSRSLVVAMTLLVVGFASGNLLLAGAAIAGLLASIGAFYYSLEMTLLQKSALLMGVGTVLLLARVALTRRWAVQDRKERSRA